MVSEVLSASGDFALPEELRGQCIFMLVDGAVIEYVTPAFRPDAGNRHTHVKMGLARKYACQIQRKKTDEQSIKRAYEHALRLLFERDVQPAVDNIPLEQSQRVFLGIINRALEEHAVDVHWVVREQSVRILFRIYGRIERMDEFAFTRDFATGLLGAIYGSSKDVSDKSFSPRNRSACTLRYSDPAVAIRWQTIPTGDAEAKEYDIVLRVTRQDIAGREKVISLEDLGYLKDQVQLLAAACNSPGGIIMSGITGSGKTTALRSLMQMARGNGDKKIYTAEDPIELKIFGATQVSARSANIASYMESFLRADPDIIMVGEIRNKDIAGVMQDVIRSGHKMMTTIHAPSALGIVPRLSSDAIGVHRETIVEPGFVSALVYQYLMPMLCQHCKLPVSDHEDRVAHIRHYLFDERWYALDPATMYIRNKKGCQHCRRGVAGMTICAEVIRPTFEISQFLRDRRDAEALRAYRMLRHKSFDHPATQGKTAYEVAIYKASQGLIDPVDIDDMCGAMELQEIFRGAYESGL